ncbi:hypothetical protein Lal_00037718, partial [Lupinus albus]
LETHIFHLPCGECIITLEDVSLQIGVNVNGLPITGPAYFDWNELCAELLGGATCLANLYREMCRTTKPNSKAMSGWGQRNVNYQGIPRGDLGHAWIIWTSMILVQALPQSPKNFDALHRVDKQGNLDPNWATKHAQWIEYLSHRRDQVLQGPQIQYLIHTQQYMIWYRTNSRLFLSSETQLRDPRQINFQHNQPPTYQTNQPPTYYTNQPPPYHTNQPPHTIKNQPLTPQTP